MKILNETKKLQIKEFKEFTRIDRKHLRSMVEGIKDALQDFSSDTYLEQDWFISFDMLLSCYLDSDICFFYLLSKRLLDMKRFKSYGYDYIIISKIGYVALYSTASFNEENKILVLPIKFSMKELSVITGVMKFYNTLFENYLNENENTKFKDFCKNKTKEIIAIDIEKIEKTPLIKLKNMLLFYKRIRKGDI